MNGTKVASTLINSKILYSQVSQPLVWVELYQKFVTMKSEMRYSIIQCNLVCSRTSTIHLLKKNCQKHYKCGPQETQEVIKLSAEKMSPAYQHGQNMSINKLKMAVLKLVQISNSIPRNFIVVHIRTMK